MDHHARHLYLLAILPSCWYIQCFQELPESFTLLGAAKTGALYLPQHQSPYRVTQSTPKNNSSPFIYEVFWQQIHRQTPQSWNVYRCGVANVGVVVIVPAILEIWIHLVSFAAQNDTNAPSGPKTDNPGKNLSHLAAWSTTLQDKQACSTRTIKNPQGLLVRLPKTQTHGLKQSPEGTSLQTEASASRSSSALLAPDVWRELRHPWLPSCSHGCSILMVVRSWLFNYLYHYIVCDDACIT